MLVASYIYIVIHQRLLFLVFAILNLTAAIIYSIYFLITRGKSSSKSVTQAHKNGLVIEAGNVISCFRHSYVLHLDVPLNEELLPSSPMMVTTKNDNEQ